MPPSSMYESPCPVPLESVAVCSRSPTARCPKGVRQCAAQVALPTAPRQCGSIMWDFHYPLPQALW